LNILEWISRENMSWVDAAWLRMEHPTNLMQIAGILEFDEPLDFGELKRMLEDRLLQFNRFRQRVIFPRIPFGRIQWAYDRRFDLDYHLRRIALPSPGDKAALQEVVSNLMSTPLDFSKPLWQGHLIEQKEGGCVLLFRLHHCIADGISLVRLLLSMTQMSEDDHWERKREGPASSRQWSPMDSVLRAVVSAWNGAVQLGGRVAGEVKRLREHPEVLGQWAATSVKVGEVLGHLLMMPPDPPTPFKGPLGVVKKVAWSQSVPLEQVKKVSKHHGATVNDILLTAMTGALRRYIEDRGGDTENVAIRAVVPVYLGPVEGEIKLGNYFGLVFLELPVGVADLEKRLTALKARMDHLKTSPEALVTYALLGLIGMVPQNVQKRLINMFGSKATAVMTNVPGPRQPLYLLGQPVRTLMFWVPQSGRLGLGVSIFSYSGNIYLGLAVDANLVRRPEKLIAMFEEEMAEMIRSAGLTLGTGA
jgi:WS/DGAT/MGAT family acyltransferase